MPQILILGAGGFAREVFDIYCDLGRENDVLGFVEENAEHPNELLNGKPIFDAVDLKIAGTHNNRLSGSLLVGGMGSPRRRRWIEELSRDYRFDTLLHPSVKSTRWVEIGEGAIITANCVLTCNIKIGRHVILNLGVNVGHDADIGDFSTVNPASQVMGGVKIGKEVYVGVGAVISDHVRIGDGAVVAAGAVVVEDVPEMSMVAGVPAKVKKTYASNDEKPI